MNLNELIRSRLWNWPANATSLYRVSYWILVLICAGLVAVYLQLSPVMWAFSALSCGGLLGFLFGIPRVEQGVATTPANGSLQDAEDGSSRRVSQTIYRQTVNTNLTEISDWLTKIIVGVSLVQMTQIPPNFESLVKYLAGSKYEPGFVGSVIVFFGVTGFISSYLLTRLFLATAFSEADRAANEFNLQSTRLPDHRRPSPEGEMLALIRRSPREAVLINWQKLLDSAQKAIRHRGGGGAPKLAASIMNKLIEMQLIDDDQADTFNKLRNLRNIAAHSSESISEEAAIDYVNNAEALREHLDSREP